MWKPTPIKKADIKVGGKYIEAGIDPDGELAINEITFTGRRITDLPIRAAGRGVPERYRRTFKETPATKKFLKKLSEAKDVIADWLALIGVKDTKQTRDKLGLASAEWYDA